MYIFKCATIQKFLIRYICMTSVFLNCLVNNIPFVIENDHYLRKFNIYSSGQFD